MELLKTEVFIINDEINSVDCLRGILLERNHNFKILIIIPAYNEESNIENTLQDILEKAPDYDILVVDDCSTDSTKSILKKKNIDYLSFISNLGIGGGVQAGYIYAYENCYDIAIQFDGDGQHKAEYLEKLVKPIIDNQADYVIGSRFVEKEGFQSTIIRRAGIKFLSFLIRLLCGVNILDCTSGMRAINRKMIKKFAFDYAQDYPEPGSMVNAILSGARIAEVPVQMRGRKGGKSSINTISSIYYMFKVSLALFLIKANHSRSSNK